MFALRCFDKHQRRFSHLRGGVRLQNILPISPASINRGPAVILSFPILSDPYLSVSLRSVSSTPRHQADTVELRRLVTFYAFESARIVPGKALPAHCITDPVHATPSFALVSRDRFVGWSSEQ